MARKIFMTLLSLILSINAFAQQWSIERATEWKNGNPWFCGVNYIPAYAINYTAMWDKSSFSAEDIRSELTLMKNETGMNCIRFVMQYKVYEDNPKLFLKTLDKVLAICDGLGIKAMPIFFDDCVFGTGTDPVTGPQPEPLEGWYAWAWSPSPGLTMVVDERTHGKLEKYVKDVIGRFRDDPRIMLWDLYNEPTNSSMSDRSWPLLRKVFKWAREINPSQPVSAGIWNGNAELEKFLAENSDIITFHCYADPETTKKMTERMKEYGRPVICTEWMNRVAKSTIKENLHLFADLDAGCIMWGLVNGKTQTHLCWGHRPEQLPYTGPWQHDIYHSDHTPYDKAEIELIRETVRRKNR